MGFGRESLLLATAIILAFPAASAATGETHVNLHMGVAGTSTLNAGIQGAFGIDAITREGDQLIGETMDGPAVRVNVTSARVVIVRDPIVGVKGNLTPVGPYSPFEDVTGLGDDSDSEEFAFTGTISIFPHAENSVVRALPFRQGDLMTTHLSLVGPTALRRSASLHLNEARPSFEGRFFSANANSPAVALNTQFAIQDGMAIFAFESLLNLTNSAGSRVVETGTIEDAGADSPIPGSDWHAAKKERVQVFIFANHASAVFADAWTLHVATVSLPEARMLSFSGLESMSGEPVAARGHSLVRLSGIFRAEADYRKPTAAWTVDGTASAVEVDGTRVATVDAIGPPVVAAVAGGVGILLALAVLFKGGGIQWISGVVGRNRAEPLANMTRIKILAHVQHEPGITVSELCKQVQIRRQSLLFHTGILRRSGHLTAYRTRWQWHFASASLPTSTTLAHSATNRHPIRKGIAEALAKGPSATSQISDALAAAGIATSPSLLSYHLRIMMQSGQLMASYIDGRRAYILAAPPKPIMAAGTTVSNHFAPRVEARSTA